MVLITLSLFLVGCPASHGRPDDAPTPPVRVDDASTPTPRVEAGTGDIRVDSGTSSPDAGIADAAPLPAEEEPVVESGQRPSELPGAEEWVPTPDFPDADCCEVGEPVPFDDETGGSGFHESNQVTWAGNGWAVATGIGGVPGPELHYGLLDPDVTRFLAYRRTGVRANPQGMAYAGGRVAITAMPRRRDSDEVAGLGIFDRVGTTVAPFNGATHGVLARQLAGRMWVVLSTGRERPWAFRGYDDGGRLVAETDVPLTGGFSGHDYALQGMVSRVVGVSVDTEGRLEVQSLVVGEGPVGGPWDAGPANVRFAFDDGASYDHRLRTTRLRDRVAVSHATEDGRTWITLLDPFERELVERFPLAEAFVTFRSAGLAGSDKFGLLGACYVAGEFGSGEREDTETYFALFGEDGERRGDPVLVNRTNVATTNCAVAYHNGRFVVLTLEYTVEDRINRLVARSVTPTLP